MFDIAILLMSLVLSTKFLFDVVLSSLPHSICLTPALGFFSGGRMRRDKCCSSRLAGL